VTLFRIIFSAVLLIVLAVLVVLNLESTTSVNLFGRQLEDISVVAIGLVSFVAGVVYSFIIYVGNYLARARRDRLSRRERTVKEKEKAGKAEKKQARKVIAASGEAAGEVMTNTAAGGQGVAAGTSDARGEHAAHGTGAGGGDTDSSKKKSGGLFGRKKRKKGGGA
ncbi:MAG: hypothetical protein ACLFM5_12130, partial [Spirochaetaceae bacterium]